MKSMFKGVGVAGGEGGRGEGGGEQGEVGTLLLPVSVDARLVLGDDGR